MKFTEWGIKKVFTALRHFFPAQTEILEWVYRHAHERDLFFSWQKHPFVNIESFIDDSEECNKNLQILMEGFDKDSIEKTFRFVDIKKKLKTSNEEEFLCSIRSFLSRSEKEAQERWKQEKMLIQEELQILNIEEPSGFFHHGLRFCSDAIQEYIRGKVFIDAGAYVGDSSLILMKYLPSVIYAFDISKKNEKLFAENISKNVSDVSLIQFYAVGLGKNNCQQFVSDVQFTSMTVANTNGEYAVDFVTLDYFMSNNNNKIGFVKADLEGGGWDFVQGMAEVLKRDRPVLSLSIYHTADEFFKIKPFIESLNLNYCFEFQHHGFHPCLEYVLFAYPAELKQTS